MSIVELVKVGFLGFAVAIMLLSFFLLQKIMSSSSFEGENLIIRCQQVHRFMLMSLAVILIGMGWELASRMVSPHVSIRFDITPPYNDNIKDIRVKAGNKRVDISKDENVQMEMEDGDEVSLDLSPLTVRISEMEKRYEGYENHMKTLQQQRAAEEFKAAPEEAGI